MADEKNPPVSAAELRQHIAEMEAQRIADLMKKREKAEASMKEFVDHFMQDDLDADEIADIRSKMRHAAEQGRMEVMVLRFPSKLCTDHGRAINNSDAEWPQTLPGKAAALYARWDQKGRDLGYKMHALIIDFPDGLPGDVGLFVSWAP